MSRPYASRGMTRKAGLAQPDFHPPISLATVLRIVWSDWQVLPVSVEKRRRYASHLLSVGDRLCAALRKCEIHSGAVGGTKEQDLPLLVGWIAVSKLKH
jgi:hypothetical protein